MYCVNCGARLPEDSLFCEECGTRVLVTPKPEDRPAPPRPAQPKTADWSYVSPQPTEPEPVKRTYAPMSPPQPAAPPVVPPAAPPSAFARAQTMTEAAGVAISRSREGRWSYWDSPGSFTDNAKSLLRFAQKEDKRLSRIRGGEGMLYYVVSASGSVGQVYADEMNDGKHVLEWVFCAPGESAETLPSAPDML